MAAVGPAIASPVTVMVIGDSISAGYNGTQADPGYRQDLLNDLASQGKQIQYVGVYDPTTYTGESYNLAGYSQAMTAMGQNQIGAFSGYSTNEILQNLDAAVVPSNINVYGVAPNMGGYWMTGGNGTGRSAIYPDIVLLMIGTDDPWQGIPIGDTSTPGTTLGNIALLLQWFNVNRPLTHVVLSTPPWNLAGYGGTNEIAAQESVLPGYIASNFPQDRFLDMVPVVPPGDISGDGVHPTDAGYALMAQAWAGAVSPLIQNDGYTHTGNAFVFASTVPSVTGSLGHWQGQFDVSSDDLIVTGGNLATITNQIKSGYANGTWGGLGGGVGVDTGITSSAAADDTTHLTALGVMQNDNGSGSPIYPTFDGQTSASADVLVKYTYYGDANLDGKVDGSDYSRIDNGYLSQSGASPLTGWANGDFNYVGVIDGSDYTLIDNAFNTQGASLSAASSTAQIAAAVPEPSSAGLAAVGLVSAGLSMRRRKFSK